MIGVRSFLLQLFDEKLEEMILLTLMLGIVVLGKQPKSLEKLREEKS